MSPVPHWRSGAPGLRVKSNGDFTTVNLTVRPVAGAAGMPDAPLYLVIIEDAPPLAPEQERAGLRPIAELGGAETDTDARVAALKRELRAKEEYLQAANEELETSNEELKSSNEEMQLVNEELQSTNEELETSKEELQSVNEELATVNAELQTKVADLSRANNDMNNLLGGTGIGTVFVDHQLRILRFTPAATRIINLILSDVGRPVNHILSNLAGYDRLVEDVQAVLDNLVHKEVEVQTRAGEWYSMRIMPYRTLDNVIEGAVITFVDISRAKKAQEALQESESHFRQLAEALPQPVWLCLPDGRCDCLNRQWVEFTGVPGTQQMDFGWLAQIHPDDRDKLMAAWKTAAVAGEPFQLEFRVRHHSGEYHRFDLRATALRNSAGRVVKWFAMNAEIPAEKSKIGP